eukprot:1836102-Rhodomonas_salina.1
MVRSQSTRTPASTATGCPPSSSNPPASLLPCPRPPLASQHAVPFSHCALAPALARKGQCLL